MASGTLTNDDAVKQATAALSGDETPPEKPSASEPIEGTTSSAAKTRTYQDVLNGLSPTDRELMETTVKGLQSSKDKALSKLQGVDEATLQAVRAVQADPKLQTAVQQTIAAYHAGKLTSGEAKDAVKEAVEDSFDAMMDDATLSGQDRAVLRRFRTAIVKEAKGVIAPYETRLQTVESLLLKSKLDERDATLSTLKEQMGTDLYEKYEPLAQRYLQVGVAPDEAFRAVMKDPDDLAAWANKQRSKPSKSVSTKKVASEVMASSVPSAEELPLKEGASRKEQKDLTAKGIGLAVSRIFGQ